MTQEQAINYVVVFLMLAALAIGLLSVLVGKVVALWDWACIWWQDGIERQRQRYENRATRYGLRDESVNRFQENAAPENDIMSREETGQSAFANPEPEPLGSAAFSLLNGAEPDANRSTNPSELQLNAAEVAGLQRMIDHNKTAAKPSKSSTIQAGFGVSRGGSESYRRASEIYDALFGAPALAVKFRERTPEQQQLREQLQLDNR